ncbi:MAG: hypothetical protein JWP78_2208 [Mucilaginibacter sp.]|nr:hypothetical protein [Mucilaginibacter sp.]
MDCPPVKIGYLVAACTGRPICRPGACQYRCERANTKIKMIIQKLSDQELTKWLKSQNN